MTNSIFSKIKDKNIVVFFNIFKVYIFYTGWCNILVISAIFMFLAAFIPGKMQVFIFLSLAFGIIDLMLPSAWALCIDLGKKYSGAVSGAMNTAGNLGGFSAGGGAQVAHRFTRLGV